MKFYDVREATMIFSSHKTLFQACAVQQERPNDRRVVLTRLDGTRWRDLHRYSTADCRRIVQKGARERSRR